MDITGACWPACKIGNPRMTQERQQGAIDPIRCRKKKVTYLLPPPKSRRSPYPDGQRHHPCLDYLRR